MVFLYSFWQKNAKLIKQAFYQKFRMSTYIPLTFHSNTLSLNCNFDQIFVEYLPVYIANSRPTTRYCWHELGIVNSILVLFWIPTLRFLALAPFSITITNVKLSKRGCFHGQGRNSTYKTMQTLEFPFWATLWLCASIYI